MIAHFVMVQLSIHAGFKAFGERGKQATQKELKQIHNLNAYTPLDTTKHTNEEKRKAVPSLMFLKEKQCRRIKAQKCADGHKQLEYRSKEDTAFPTVCLDSIFKTSTTKAHENKDVAVIDLPGASMYASMEDKDKVIMVMEGCLQNLRLCCNQNFTRNM